ncbi:MAG: DUF692 domain-containing protein [Bdellovibrionota bacterium]
MWCNKEITGVGLGLRSLHLPHILQDFPKIPWFEILIDNYFCDGGLAIKNLSRIREHYPVAFHSVGMSIAGSDPIDIDWFLQLKNLMKKFEPAWVSDHLCWTNFGGKYFHDLLPFPMNEESLKHVSERILCVQDILQQEILLENVSSYISFSTSEYDEADFLCNLHKKTGCYILLDINNVYVSAYNNSFSAEAYLDKIPIEAVKQFHLAGYEDNGKYLLDSHGAPVWKEVWDLYKKAVQKFGRIPTLIEWDNNIPDFAVLVSEVKMAEAKREEALSELG